jgi:hypothetical protein
MIQVDASGIKLYVPYPIPRFWECTIIEVL